MSKIFHSADIHLGSKIDYLPPDKAVRRREEVLSSFIRLVDYAKVNNVNTVLLCGDIFDGLVAKRDFEVFVSAVESAPKINFLYLRGNHESDALNAVLPKNFLTFSDTWTTYNFDDVAISAIEPRDWINFYDELKLDEKKKNIVMLHGQISSSVGKNLINLKRLQDKGIDYLALGHIHSLKFGESGTMKYAYCGCLEGRGFDECGEKGFILLDIGEEIQAEFVPFSKRRLWEKEVDLSNLGGVMPAFQKIAAELDNISENDLVKVVLKGDIGFDNNGFAEIAAKRLNKFFYLKVKDLTVPKIDCEALAKEISLKGEFVRTIMSSDRPFEEKMKIIQIGIKALDGEEVEL